MNESAIYSDIERITAPLLALHQTWDQLPIQRQHRFQQLLLPVGYTFGRIGTADIGRLFNTIRASEGLNATAVASDSKFWNQLIEEIRAFSRLLNDDSDEPVAWEAA